MMHAAMCTVTNRAVKFESLKPSLVCRARVYFSRHPCPPPHHRRRTSCGARAISGRDGTATCIQIAFKFLQARGERVSLGDFRESRIRCAAAEDKRLVFFYLRCLLVGRTKQPPLETSSPTSNNTLHAICNYH